MGRAHTAAGWRPATLTAQTSAPSEITQSDRQVTEGRTQTDEQLRLTWTAGSPLHQELRIHRFVREVHEPELCRKKSAHSKQAVNTGPANMKQE